MSEETKPVAWMLDLYGPAGLFEHEDEAKRELNRRNAKWPEDCPSRKLIPLYPVPPSAAAIRAMALQECAEMVERWELMHDGADGDLSLLADDMRALAPAPSVPEGWVSVPKEPTDELLTSMAIRYDHGLGVPGYYDNLMMMPIAPEGHAARMESTKRTMRQLHEEVVGTGFYRPAAPKGTR